MTYWPGMTLKMCNQTNVDLNVTETVQTQISRKAVIQRRFDTDYESCYWQLKTEEGKMIEIEFEKTNNGKFYLYSGLERQNATAVGNGSAEIGAHYLNGSEGAIVVFQTTEQTRRRLSKSHGGSGKFSYRSVIEKPTEVVILATEEEKLVSTSKLTAAVCLIGIIAVISVVFSINYCKNKKAFGQYVARDQVLPEESQEQTVTNYNSGTKNVQSEQKMVLEEGEDKPAPPIPHDNETDLELEIPVQKSIRNKTFD